MQDRRTYILETAFRTFMKRGYDSVSITVLQQELEMSRGAMYRYFKSKDELFFEVIDRFFFGMLDAMLLTVPEGTTLSQLIELYYQNMKKVIRRIKQENIETHLLNFTALIIQAAKHYPGFIDRMREVGVRDRRMWKNAIRHGIEKGEVRADIDVDVVTGIFTAGAGSPEPTNTIGEAINKKADEWKKTADYIYSLIKT